MVRTAIHRISVGWLCFLAAAVAAFVRRGYDFDRVWTAETLKTALECG
jgi:hypothetical protein